MKTNVPVTYRHYPKHCIAQEVLVTKGAAFKWYDIAVADDPIDPAIAADARSFLIDAALPDTQQADDLGFVILHKCGATFHFLLLQIWRGANEIWEAVYYTDQGVDGFAPFPDANPGPGKTLRPTFCVWEMGTIAFEVQTWAEFLLTARDDNAVQAYLDACFEGKV